MKIIIYLANAYGFSKQYRHRVLPAFVAKLTQLGATVWEPSTRNDHIDFAAADSAHRVGRNNLRAVAMADAIFAIVNGHPSDEGVMVELGAVIALGEKTFLFRDDCRRCTDCEQYPLNLMLFTGLPSAGWEDFYDTSIEDMGSPKKALARWLNQSQASSTTRC